MRVLPGQFAAEVERSRAVVARAQALLLDRTYKRDKEGQFAATTGGKDVREALAGHETAEAVGTAAAAEAKRITGRDIDFDLAGSDPQIAAEHAEGILRGLERFPTTGLKAVRHGTDPEAEQREVFAVTSRDGGTITFTANAQKYGAAGYRAELKQARAEHAISAATATHPSASPYMSSVIAWQTRTAQTTQHSTPGTAMRKARKPAYPPPSRPTLAGTQLAPIARWSQRGLRSQWLRETRRPVPPRRLWQAWRSSSPPANVATLAARRG